jgi:hypothetical protein
LNRGLRFLLWRDVVGRTRAMWRRLGTGRGIAAALGVGLFLVAIALARILQWLDPAAAPPPLLAATRVRELGGLVLLLLVALNALSGRALYFRPAEIGVLFAAPLSRRELVVYKKANARRVAVVGLLRTVSPCGTERFTPVGRRAGRRPPCPRDSRAWRRRTRRRGSHRWRCKRSWLGSPGSG